ncbi:unnamed protein product, partial [Polarella glacialis]
HQQVRLNPGLLSLGICSAMLVALAYTQAFDLARAKFAATSRRSSDVEVTEESQPVAQVRGTSAEGGELLEQLRELRRLRRALPELSAPSSFVELSRAQRRIQVLERVLAKSPPAASQEAQAALDQELGGQMPGGTAGASAPADPEARLSLGDSVRRFVGAAVLQGLIFLAISWLLWALGAPLGLSVRAELLWPLGCVLGQEPGPSDAERLVQVGPLVLLLLAHVGAARVRTEAPYWRRVWLLAHPGAS